MPYFPRLEASGPSQGPAVAEVLVPLLTNSQYRLLTEVSRCYAELNPENYATAHRLYDLGLVSLTDHGRIDITDEGRRFLLGGP